MPCGPENNKGFAMKISLLLKLHPTNLQKYRFTHTPNLTAFSPWFMKKFTEDRTLVVCPSENNSITHSSPDFSCDLTGKSESKKTLLWE